MPKKAAPEPTPIMGYRARPRSRWVTLDAIDHEDGAEPFKARIRSHLTFGELDAIPSPVAGVKYTEIEEAIAPYVLEWNVMAENVETGAWEPVPPPAVAGVAAFKCVAGFEIEWLALKLKETSLGEADQEAEKKGSTPSASTAAT